jgi:hypothetical protein
MQEGMAELDFYNKVPTGSRQLHNIAHYTRLVSSLLYLSIAVFSFKYQCLLYL